MKAYPYLIEGTSLYQGERLFPIDPQDRAFNEKWLQEFLVNHPDILPTHDIEPIFYPIVPIGKEVQVEGGRIDLLYLSLSGYPVIVETKLWRNPESKREVVAQVLDLAFAFSKWDYNQLDEYTRRFSVNYYGKERSLVELIEESLGEVDFDQNEFRDKVEKNLALGRFLLSIVGDKIRTSAADIFSQLSRFPGLGLELAMIELECFNIPEKKSSSILIVPRIVQKSEIIERSIIEIRIQQDQKKPEIEIFQEKKIEKGKKTSRPTITESVFWEGIKKNSPDVFYQMKEFVSAFSEDPLIEIMPGVNGLVFRRILSESDRAISLFFITADAYIHVRLQAPLGQFKSLYFDTKVIYEFGEVIKSILNGFSAPFAEVNIDAFRKAVMDFSEKIGALEFSRVET